MSDRFFSLLSKHQRFDDALQAEQNRAEPDTARLQYLKRMKLRIKDRMVQLMRTGRALQSS